VIGTAEELLRGGRDLGSACVVEALVDHLRLYSVFRRRSYELLRSLVGRAIVWGKDNNLPESVLASALAPSVVEAFKLSLSEEAALRMLNSDSVREAVRATEHLAVGAVPRPEVTLGQLLSGEWSAGRVLETVRRRLGRSSVSLSGFQAGQR